jgi:20S proteasome alpha/beta subunit
MFARVPISASVGACMRFVVDTLHNMHRFLGSVDLHGTSFEEKAIATGFGAHLALPLLRNAYRPDLTQGEAEKVIEDCMRILFYRDARAFNRVCCECVCPYS